MMNLPNQKMSKPSIFSSVIDDLALIHDRLRKKYDKVDLKAHKVESDTKRLMPFNGYYLIDSDTGAFLTVDTNMIILNNSSTPVYDINLIISLDGKSSNIYEFTGGNGTFDGEKLRMSPTKDNPNLPELKLKFKREDSNNLITAKLKGKVKLPNETEVEVKGTTYNNIIPMSMYEGTYYENVLGVYEDPILEISENFKINYKGDQILDTLKPLESYIYNMNMYFFSFYDGKNLVKLVMGTSAGGGLECNNLIVTTDKKVNSRSLQSVKKTINVEPIWNKRSKALGKYSGFYLISSKENPEIKKNAFISVEGQYKIPKGATKREYKVTVGISLDGVTSSVYIVDTPMKFKKDTLTIPLQGKNEEPIVIKFKRDYVPGAQDLFGSLVSVSGKINGYAFTGATPLNPVPLSGFKGAPMIDSSTKTTETLTIVSDTEITYNGHTYTEFLYIPVMYILAFTSVDNGVVVLSLGTDGGKGNACIVTTNAATDPKISSVFAIPDGKSGQDKAPQD